MKKLFTIFTAISLYFSVMAATFTFDSDASTNQTIEGVSVAVAQGSGQTAPSYKTIYGTNTGELRLYAQNTITITATQITSVQLVCSKSSASGKAYAPLTASTGTLVSGGESSSNTDKKIDTWTGSTESLVFTMGSGQRALYQIVVNGDPITIDSTHTDEPTEPEALDPEYVYAEPTAIIVPDTNFFKSKYSFVQNNIRVTCSTGSILNNDSTYYFNCNAGETITFEASQPFKGLVINGAVRKEFSATTDKGTMEYLSPDALYEADYQEEDPVLVIKDIDSTSVSITCQKQLRCYAVRFYFEANPTETISEPEEHGEGETIFLTFNTADAVYESEISEEEKMPNYTIYMYNDSSDIPLLALDLYPATTGDLIGTYEFEDGSLGEYTYYDFSEELTGRTWIEEGAVAITKEGNSYTISGYVTCDDKNTYNFTFTGEMPFYTDTEYYSEEEEEAIENIPALNNNAAMYDILGRPVGRNYKGVVIQNGNKYLLR